jgi:Serine phosphatase RsbU, regulator of sigma subunit
VSGKGVPASLVMAVSRTLFRNVATHIDEPSDIMKAMNVNLCDGNTDCMFVTMLVGVFDLQTGLLRYCNAGHTPPVLINEKAEFLSLHKIAPLGLMANIPYVTEEVVIEPQTTVFLYTDGLNEAMDADGNLFGDDRIIDEMSHAIQDGQLSPKAVIDRTIQAVHQFVGDYEQSDDLTMLAFKHTLA